MSGRDDARPYRIYRESRRNTDHRMGGPRGESVIISKAVLNMNLLNGGLTMSSEL